jgi:type I restriction enzyme, R subunit
MKTFNEDTRVKFPACGQFLRLGYNYQPLKDAEINFDTKIFINRFKPAIEKINSKTFNDNEILNIVNEIDSSIKNNDLGRDFYTWLINPDKKVKLIDFDNLENNDFAFTTELPFSPNEGTEEGSFRPDINILINGMPLAFLEVKKPNNEGGIQVEFNRMINKRLNNDKFKKFFNLIQIVSFSNNMEYEDEDSADAEDVKCGSFYTTPNSDNTTFSFFREDIKDYHTNYPYQEINDDILKEVIKAEGYNPQEAETDEFKTNLSVYSPCNEFITSLYDKERFMYFLHYGIMYLTEKKEVKDTNGNVIETIPVPQKHIMRYPQFFATRAIIKKLDNGDKRGIIWHTQGSGKTALAAFSNHVLKDYYVKKGINLKMFFIVDRLDLLIQASDEFANRYFNVINCSSKREFTNELTAPLSKTVAGTIGSICVVNIQKFIDDYGEPANDYDLKVQRVFFIDEAHRSYAKGTGEFYKNLMTCDPSGVFIAMTGTPLLTKKERSNLRFGDYIHKYFYDKSIADGYTLRIKKEDIETVAKSEIRANLDIESQNLDKNDVYESNDFVSCVSKYIEKDFNYFRLENSDKTIGGMIVCRSNTQAKAVWEWFENNSTTLKAGLVISDSQNAFQSERNKYNQKSFKDDNFPDLLVVHYMLTTGYDVKRLKKMYLLRAPKAQNLLQTISRVNRPYKNKNINKTYKYGYIVDFVDIDEEYNRSLNAYIQELEEGSNVDGDEGYSLTGLVVDKEDIQRKYMQLVEELNSFPIDQDNLEKFNISLTYLNRVALLKIRKILNGIKDCEVEFKLSNAKDYAEQIDVADIKAKLKLIQNRIGYENITSNPVDTFAIMNNKEVIEIIYEFLKVKTQILNLDQLIGDNPKINELKDVITSIQNEIQRNKNTNDLRIRKLEELLQKVFKELNIDNISELTEELKQVYDGIKNINDENDRLAEIYGGHYSFVKTYSESFNKYSIEKSESEKVLLITYSYLQDKLKGDAVTVQGKANFISHTKSAITKKLFEDGLYSKVKGCIDDILGDLYTNIQLFM